MWLRRQSCCGSGSGAGGILGLSVDFLGSTIRSQKSEHVLRSGMSRATTPLLGPSACDATCGRQVFPHPHLPPRAYFPSPVAEAESLNKRKRSFVPATTSAYLLNYCTCPAGSLFAHDPYLAPPALPPPLPAARPCFAQHRISSLAVATECPL